MAVAILSWCVGGSEGIALADDQPQLTAARLKELTASAVKSGSIVFDSAKYSIKDGVMFVNDAVILGTDQASGNPYVSVFLDQVEIDLRRQQLLQRPNSRQIMDPYYDKMEEIVAKKLAIVEDKQLADDERNKQLGDLDDQMNTTYKDGLEAVAKSAGAAKFEFIAEARAKDHAVQLVAPAEASIDMISQSFASLLKEAGQKEADFPWSNYKGGDTAQLLDVVYYCRVSLNGRQVTYTKTVGQNTTTLKFPNP